jgi:hypothetical protein
MRAESLQAKSLGCISPGSGTTPSRESPAVCRRADGNQRGTVTIWDRFSGVIVATAPVPTSILLGARFKLTPDKAFSVEREVASWVAERKFRLCFPMRAAYSVGLKVIFLN